MTDQRLTGIAIAVGLLRYGKHDAAADWLQELMARPADEETLQVLGDIAQECADLEELPAPRCLD